MKKSLYAILATLGIFLGSFGLAQATTSVFQTFQGGTGTSTPSGILYGDAGATSHINTVTIGSNLTFSGGTLSASAAGTPGGASSTIQYNANGVFAGGNIFTDGTNLGIGTSTPGAALDVVGTAIRQSNTTNDATNKAFKFLDRNFTNSQNDFLLVFGQSKTSGNTLLFGGGQTGYTAASAIGFFTGTGNNTDIGTSRLSIDSSGNVLVANLTGSKVVFTDSSKNLTSTGIGTSAQFIKGDGSLDSSTYIATALAKGNFLVGNDAGAAQATSTIFISSTGNVGIGTTSPYANLSVMVGGDYLSHAVSTLFAIGSSTAGTATTTLFAISNSGAMTYGGVTANPTVTGTGNLVLNTAPALANATVSGQLTVSSSLANTGNNITLSGNPSRTAWTTAGTGIKQNAQTYTDTSSSGTLAAEYINAFKAPTFAFTSASVVTNAYGTYFEDPVQGANATLTNKWALGADSANISGTVLTAGGSVGIGTTTPGSLLSIGGSGTGWNFYDNATSTKNGVGGININDGCYAFKGTCLTGGGSGTVTSIATNNGITGGTITTTGTIGLATISANSVLGNTSGTSAVPSSLATSSLFTWTGTGDVVRAASPTLSGTVGGALTFSGALTLSSALTYGGVALSNAVTGTGNMVLSASPTFTGTITAAAANFSGNVGVGTTTPGGLLSIFAKDQSVPLGTNLFLVGSSTATATTTLFNIRNNGNIGVGTTSPGSLLSIGNTTGWNFSATATSTESGAAGINLTAGCFAVNGTCVGGSSGVTGSGSAGQATFWSGASAVSGDNSFWWDNTNKFLGIGTSTPTSDLTIQQSNVPGTIKIYMWGGGGGGGANAGGGGGGGGGSYVVVSGISSGIYTVIVGNGGSNGGTGTGGAGKAAGGNGTGGGGGGGGSSSFGTNVACGGGGGSTGSTAAGGTAGTTSGGTGASGNVGNGGGGGCGTAGSGTTGGTGGSAVTGTGGNGAGSTLGGGGGSSAGASGNGSNGSGTNPWHGGTGSGGAAAGVNGTGIESGGGGTGDADNPGGSPGGGGGGNNGGTGGAGGNGLVVVVFTPTTGSVSTTTYSTPGTFTYSQAQPIFSANYTAGGIAMSIDSTGHLITGGTAPTCGTGCTSVTGDDKTMNVIVGSSITSATVNFANSWSKTPICIATEDDSGLTGGADASTTASTVVISLSAALTTKHIGLICQASANFTY